MPVFFHLLHMKLFFEIRGCYLMFYIVLTLSCLYFVSTWKVMDSQVVVDGLVLRGSDSQVAAGHLLDIVEKSWREDKLPDDDIAVPIAELPDPEADNGDSTLTLKEQDQKWKDLALGKLNDQQEALSNW